MALSGTELRQFDFNTAESPNQAGWISVKRSDVYNGSAGFGWTSPASGDAYDSRALGDDVVKDGHVGRSGTFRLLVKPGATYELELVFRDKRPKEFQVSVEGHTPRSIQLPKMTTRIEQFNDVVSADNVLTIQFSAAAREQFIINGIKIIGEAVVPNQAPIANDDWVTVDEDNEAAINVLANDLDADGDSLTVISSTQAMNGKASHTAGVFTYIPNADFFGDDSFRYTISDGNGGTSSGVVQITVRGVNDHPVAKSDSGSGFQTEPDTELLTANVLHNDFDPDFGDALQIIEIDTTGTKGGVQSKGDGTFQYIPPPGYVGSDSFTYTIADEQGETASAAVTISIREQIAASGIWINAQEIMALPTSGMAWDTLLAAANKTANTPDIQNQDDNTDVLTLAKALVGVRLGNQQLIAQARMNIMAAIGTEAGGRTLALGRNLASYVIAADIVGLDSEQDAIFRTWLRTTLTENLDGRSLQSTHEDRPNNWGTMAGGSRMAVALYLGDLVELERAATVFKGYLGDRSAYADFNFGSDLSWQADPSEPVGVNPKGAMKDGHSIDGALPDEMRRGGSFSWPPAETGYAWEALQGALVQAEILHRAGYDSWQWQDQALLRAVEFLYGIGWDAEGDDLWQPWLINARYGTTIATDPAARHGKIIGWTSWTHQPRENANSEIVVVSTLDANVGTSSVIDSGAKLVGMDSIVGSSFSTAVTLRRDTASHSGRSDTLFEPTAKRSAHQSKNFQSTDILAQIVRSTIASLKLTEVKRPQSAESMSALDEFLATWP